MIKNKIGNIVTHEKFNKIFTALSIIFIILTFFIALDPTFFVDLGYGGIFLFNVISSGLLLMPLLIKEFNIFALAIVSALGNIFNTSVSYFIGYKSYNLFSKIKIINNLKVMLLKFGVIMVFILAILPLPLDLNGLLSGYIKMSYRKYVAVNFLGKVVLFLLVSLGIITIPKLF